MEISEKNFHHDNNIDESKPLRWAHVPPEQF